VPATISHALSMTSPNDTRYENQVSNWNQTHALTLNAVGSEISGGFGNAGGVTFGYDGTNVTAAAPAGAPSPINFSAGTTSSNIGSVVFSNSGGVSFGLNASTITATVATNYQSQGAYLTTADLSANSSKYVQNWKLSGNTSGTTSSAQGTDLWLAGGNGVTLSGSSNTISFSVATNYQSQAAYLTTAMQSNAATISNVNLSAGTTSNNLSAFVLSNSNNFSFGLSGSTVTASYTVPTVSGHGLGVSNTGNTLGNTGTQSTGTIVFAGSGAITASQSTGVGISTIWYSVAAQSNQSAIKGFGASNTGNTAGNTGISSGIDWVIAGTNNITVSESTAAGGPNTIWLSAPSPGAGVAAGISNTGNTAGNTGTVSSGTLVFAASGGITASESTAAGQSTLWFSVANPVAQTNQTVGLYALGNTTQNSSTTLDARTMSFNGLGAATWGYSNGSIQVSVPATSSIVGTSGISVSTAGSTISVLPKPLSVWDPYPYVTGQATSSHAPASFWFSKINLDWPVAVSYANVLKSLNVSAPGMSSQNSSLTNKFSYSHGLTLFTRQDFAGNSSNMSQWTTASFGMTGTLSQSSSSASVALSWVTNSTGGTTSFSTTSGSNLWTNFFTGMQMFRIPLVTTLTPGEYFIGQAHSSTTATVGSNFTLLSVSNFHVVPQSNSFATITSSGSLVASSPDGGGIGVASAVTTNNTMALSVVSAGTQNWWYMNFSNT
jgi:hypothetical protein